MNELIHPTDQAEFWESRYRLQETGWDLGTVSPPLKSLIEHFRPTHAPLKVLVPGAGYGHEAAFLLRTGYSQVTVLDLAASPLQHLRKALDTEASGRLKLVQENFFSHQGHYDLILEQTFFCALHPDHRPAYARDMAALLNPGGLLAGVLFDREFERNPPFGGRAPEYESLLSPYFRFLRWEACPCSHPARAGTEWWMILEKK